MLLQAPQIWTFPGELNSLQFSPTGSYLVAIAKNRLISVGVTDGLELMRDFDLT